MRQIILDTETTGLAWEKGNRIVEIGCLELVARRPTGRHFHRYFNPGREMEAGAQEVTGLTLEFLQDKPAFATAVDELLEFIAGAELIIHNASFDVGFLDYELSLAGAHYGRIADHATVLDTLAMARERWPGQRNSLDALCKRLGVDNAHRKLHGALLDAELLAEVYLGMTSGQADLGLAAAEQAAPVVVLAPGTVVAARRVLRADPAERAAHAARLERIAAKSGKRLWPVEADAFEPVA
jgi:DNA polymerase III subunit epsilon